MDEDPRGFMRMSAWSWVAFLLIIYASIMCWVLGFGTLGSFMYTTWAAGFSLRVFQAEHEDDVFIARLFRAALLVCILALFYQHWLKPVAWPTVVGVVNWAGNI